jgi:hypothetical protein
MGTVLRTTSSWIVKVVQSTDRSLGAENMITWYIFTRRRRIRNEHPECVPSRVRRVNGILSVVMHIGYFHIRCGHGMNEAAAVLELATASKVFPTQLEAVLSVGTMRVVQLDVLLGAFGH